MKTIDLFEAPKQKKYEHAPLKFSMSDYGDHANEQTMEIHYNVLYKNYVTKANSSSDAFQAAGAELHELYFSNICDNAPPFAGRCRSFINEHFGSLTEFKKQFTEIATTIQGNGWCALLNTGSIIQIPNHKSTKNVVLILDMWEHAYFLTHGADKKAYVSSFWSHADWDVVTQRLLV